jgi:L-malate glycosyltransferase
LRSMQEPVKAGQEPVRRCALRVLHVASGDLWAGAEVQVFHIVRALSREPGFEVEAVVLNEGRLAQELRGVGVKVTLLDEHRLGAWRLLTRLVRVLRASKARIIHTHRYKENVLAAIAAKWVGAARMISTVHGLPETAPRGKRWKARLTRWADLMALRYGASDVVAVSAEIAARLERLAPGRVKIIGNSFSLRSVRAPADSDGLRQSLGIPPGEERKIVGTVGRLVPVKGMDLFVDCALELVKARRNLICIIVGDGPERARLHARISGADATGRIILAGFRENVHEIMNLFDVLVIPSRHEGVPTVLLEGLALAKGVVATAVGGILDVVEHNVNGVLVQPDHPSGWVPAVLSLIDSPETAHRLGLRGRGDVMERWSVNRQVAKLCDLYRRLPATPHRRRWGMTRRRTNS